MTLSELLAITGHHAEPHPHGGFQVFINNERNPEYWHLDNYHMRASLSGPSLHLYPKNPAAQCLGKAGGVARASKLTAERRIEIAREGGKARAKNRKSTKR